MHGITVYEFDVLVAKSSSAIAGGHVQVVPDEVHAWLEAQCLRSSTDNRVPWLRLTQRRGCRAVQVTSSVGVISAPGGYQVEVLPKIGRTAAGNPAPVRRQLLDMLSCLHGFRHVRTDHARLLARRMPLLDVFVAEFLHAVEDVIKHGLRRDYTDRRGNLFALRGKLVIAEHLRQNLVRADRFFTEHDQFSANRPANRILHAALKCVLAISGTWANQKRARELMFLFADIPLSTHPASDFEQIQLDRGMSYYAEALAWARLILNADSPLTGSGDQRAPSLLFPMEAVFEAFVAKHLRRQFRQPFKLRSQARSRTLICHREQQWFRLKPDLLVRNADRNVLVLDTKWKLLDASGDDGSRKYGLSETDFYQLLAYGLNYLDGCGDMALVYPATEQFNKALPVFEFPKAEGLRLWVLPFCLESRKLLLPGDGPLAEFFNPVEAAAARKESRPQEVSGL